MRLTATEVNRVAISLRSCGHLFDSCSLSETRKVIKAGLLNAYSPGEYVFWKTDQGQAMYAIVAGEVEIRLAEAEGERVLARLGPGDVFGEMALASRGTRSASAMAGSTVELFVLNEGEVQRLMDQHPGIASKLLFNLLRLTSQRLHEELDLSASRA